MLFAGEKNNTDNFVVTYYYFSKFLFKPHVLNLFLEYTGHVFH
jgi:hypothetical protein